jgi:pyruvate/2-oxoglutarate dehydrogenase complex dihydrolipoamide dehydrogenase (E3) component
LAQAFQRFGSSVMLLHRHAHLLDREDHDAAEMVQRSFVRDGMQLELGSGIIGVERRQREKVIHYRGQQGNFTIPFDEILVAAGRLPNVTGLNLEAVGVDYDELGGIKVNDLLQTANPRIFAAGDVCLKWKFTHAADFSARIVIQNALFYGRKKVSALNVPWTTYTDPEIAHIGLSERDASEAGVAVNTFARRFAEVDRAICDGEEDGLVKIHVRKGSDKILGATIVARHAGEMIGEISVAMAADMGLGRLASVIHPYPTQAEAIRQCGDAYNRTRLTPRVRKLFNAWLKWTR